MLTRDPLTPRQQTILRTLVHVHVDSGDPVASGLLARQAGLRVSSATVRHELSQLEQRGLIRQPHTSSGRVPTDEGYRCYVDDLMAPRNLTEPLRTRIQEALQPEGLLEERLERLASLLARLSPYAAIIQLPEDATLAVREMHLADVAQGRVLVIVISRVGAVRQRVVAIDWSNVAVRPEERPRVAGFRTEHVRGHSLGDAVTVLKRVEVASDDERALKAVAVSVAEQVLDPDTRRTPLLLDGMAHLMTQPEFRDTERARALLEVLEEKQTLRALLTDGDRPARLGTVTFAIGKEHAVQGVQDCTVALATYCVGVTTGRIALLGPVRMRYRDASALLEYASAKLTDLLAA